jgi:hypothetical protein
MPVFVIVVCGLWSAGTLFAVALCRAAAGDQRHLPDADTHEFGLRA